MRIIDLTHTIVDNMTVYPGDIRTNLFQTKYLKVNSYNDHRLDISMHTGTHIDSPMHLTNSNKYISSTPIEKFIGAGIILDVQNEPIIKMKPIYNDQIKENHIILLYTGHDKHYNSSSYYENHPIIDTGLCEFLISKNIKMIGIDLPSPDNYPFDIHKMLLENNIYIIENLTNLNSLINIDKFEIIALPLKIDADSSMARVIAIVNTDS